MVCLQWNGIAELHWRKSSLRIQACSASWTSLTTSLATFWSIQAFWVFESTIWSPTRSHANLERERASVSWVLHCVDLFLKWLLQIWNLLTILTWRKQNLILCWWVSERFQHLTCYLDFQIACAHKKNRFYIFTNVEPYTTDVDEDSSTNRDVFNEKPVKEDILTAIEEETPRAQLCSRATIHTTFGDVHVELFSDKCPKSVENFCTHARRGYYNGHQFHR